MPFRFWLQDITSFLKVRLTYWWWIVKYRGKKNIPRELVTGKVATNFAAMEENLMLALREVPDDMPAEQRKELLELIGKVQELQKELPK